MNPSKLSLLRHLIALCALALLPSMPSFAAMVCDPTAPVPTPQPGWGPATAIGKGDGVRVASNQLRHAFVAYRSEEVRTINIALPGRSPHYLTTRISYANAYRHTGGCGAAVTRRFQMKEYNSSSIDIAADDQGNAIMVWDDEENISLRRIYASRFTPASGWSDAQQIGHAATTWEEHSVKPLIVMDAAGNATVAWVDDPYLAMTTVARFTPAGGWSPQHALGGISWYYHQIAGNKQGAVLVSYMEGSNTPPHTPYVRSLSPATGAWSAPTALGAGYGNYIAMNEAGKVILVSSQRSYHYDGTSWSPGGIPTAPTVDPNLFHGLTLAAGGQAMLLWGTTKGDLRASRYENGKWAPETVLWSDSVDYLVHPYHKLDAVAGDAAGNVIATWTAQNTLWAARYNAECKLGSSLCGWNAPVALGGSVWNEGDTSLSMQPNGNALLAMYNHSAGQIQLRRYYK